MISLWARSTVFVLIFFVSAQLCAQSTVVISEVRKSDIKSELQLSGNIVAQHSVNISSEISEVVESVLVEEGDTVTKGQELLQLRQVRAKLELEIKRAEAKSAEAKLEIAAIDEKRLKKLLDKNSVSVGSYDQAAARLRESQANFAARKSEVALLEDALKRHTLLAPFDGVVVSRDVEKGAWAVLGETLLRLESHNNLRVEVAVPEKYYAQITNQKSAVKADVSFNGGKKDGVNQGIGLDISRILPFSDSARSFEIWINVDKKSGNWIPGMSAQATLQWINDDTYSLSVPRDAIVRKADGTTVVWRVVKNQDDDWTGVAIPIKVGSASGNYVAVKNNNSQQIDSLNIGDNVVVRGNENLLPGQTIKPVKFSSTGIN